MAWTRPQMDSKSIPIQITFYSYQINVIPCQIKPFQSSNTQTKYSIKLKLPLPYELTQNLVEETKGKKFGLLSDPSSNYGKESTRRDLKQNGKHVFNKSLLYQ